MTTPLPFASENRDGQPRASRRYGLFDQIRAAALLLMIAYHAMWNLVYLFGVEADWYHGWIGMVWQLGTCSVFVLLSGFCWSFGRRHLFRGTTVLLCGVLVSLVTGLFMPETMIRFGILTFLGSAMLLLIPLNKLLKAIPPAIGLTACLALFFFFWNVPNGSLGIGSLPLYTLPDSLYQNHFSAYLGFPPASFRSSDYFPLLPWFFLFLAGAAIRRFFPAEAKWPEPRFPGSRALCLIGRHSLFVYLLHQPVVYGLLLLLLGAPK